MSTVVQFKVKPRSEPKPFMSAHETGELVLFPGVRYERWDDVEEPAPSAGRRRIRDHLDLEA
jgi:hypothetical protein